MRNGKLVTSIGICVTACGSPSGVGAEPTDPIRAGSSGNPALSMRVPRAAHSTIGLGDGRVLLIGGCVRDSCEAGPDSSTVDRFDPKTGRFELAGPLLVPRVSTTTAMLPDGRVLIAGGWAGTAVTDSTEIFDPSANRSRAGPNLSSAKADMAIVTLRDGRVLFAGGFDGRNAVGAIDVFNPRDNRVRRIGTLALARTGAGAALLPNGRVLLVGGGVSAGSSLEATPTAEIIDPASGQSRLTGSLTDARYKHAVIALDDGRVLAIGGSDERDSRGKLDSIEIYDAAAGRFAPAGRLRAKRYKIGGAVTLLADGRVLVAGGAPRAEIYDPATGRSAAVGPDLGGSLNFASATRLATGDTLVAGGYYEDGIRMSQGAWLISH